MRHAALGGWLPILLVCAAQATAQPPASPVTAGAERTLRGPWRLSPDEVSELEAKVAAAPADLELRGRLLRHYMTDRTPEARAARARHVLWIIANAPEEEIAGSPATYADRIIEPELHEKARSLWLAHLEASGSNPKIVANGARFFLLSEPERARDLLERGRELEPLNPQWSERLAQLDMLSARRPGAEVGDSARKALEEFESALSLTKDEKKRYYTLAEVAEAARLAGSDEKAREYANELLRRAEELPGDWNYGNAVHEGHRILGHLELKAGDVDGAKKHLLEAGRTPGSPSLDSFGPELSLASELRPPLTALRRVSEGAAGRPFGVHPPHGARRNELDGDRPRLDRVLVPQHVEVVAPLIHEAHALRIDVGRARRIVPIVRSHRTGGDDDQAVAGMRVPAGGPSGRPDVALDVEVRRTLGLLNGQPEVPRVPGFPELRRQEVIDDVDVAETPHGQRAGGEPRGGRCQCSSGVHRAEGDSDDRKHRDHAPLSHLVLLEWMALGPVSARSATPAYAVKTQCPAPQAMPRLAVECRRLPGSSNEARIEASNPPQARTDGCHERTFVVRLAALRYASR
jgi:tetratricopeptide (TPR) repeat protein